MNRNLTEKQILERISQSPADRKNTISCGSHLIVRTFKQTAFYYVRPTRKSPVKIGKVGEMHLKEARAAVTRFLKDNAEKQEAFKQKHEENNTPQNEPTFKDIADNFLSLKKVNITELTYKNYRKFYKHCQPLFEIPIKELNNKFVKDFILKKYNEKHSAITARNVLRFIRQTMDLAVEDEIITGHNLSILMHSSSFPKVKIKGYSFFFLKDLKNKFKLLSSLSDLKKAYLLLLLFTCLRSNECYSIAYSYIDFKEKIIVIPAEIMKIKNADFKIPLTSYMEKIIRFIQRNYHQTDYLFNNDRKIKAVFFSTLRRFLVSKNVGFCLHGFRKTARSWFAEQEISLEIACKCLAHTLSFTGADRFYQKSDLLEQRREVMENWNKAVYDNLPDDFKRLLD